MIIIHLIDRKNLYARQIFMGKKQISVITCKFKNFKLILMKLLYLERKHRKSLNFHLHVSNDLANHILPAA
jgi:hypothetical protein